MTRDNEAYMKLGTMRIIVALISMPLWWYMIYRLLTAANASTFDWCLFVAYCAMGVISWIVSVTYEYATP